MVGRLQTFADSTAARARASASAFTYDLEVMRQPGVGIHLKRRMGPGIEPRYLCTDGYWRRYDAIVDLPHSTASQG